MRYKVKTDLLKHLEKGDIFTPSKSKYEWESIVERNPTWFEKIETIKVGQYWKWETGGVFRIQKFYKETGKCVVRYLKSGVEKDWFAHNLTEDARLLTDKQVQQALIEEAEKRGFREAKKIKQSHLDGAEYEIKVNNFSRDSLVDTLYLNGYGIYLEGKWASIVKDEWEVENLPNSERFYRVVKGDDYLLLSMGKRGINKEMAEAIAEALNNMEEE